MERTEILQSGLAFAWAFLVVLLAIPSIIYLAHVKNLLDKPNKRTVHISLTPRLGGIAIFAGFMSALTIFGDFGEGSEAVQHILASSIILFFIGLKDDISSVSAFKKFFVQILAVCIVVFVGDVRITNFHGVLGFWELENGVSYAFTIFVLLGLTNAINLIDGLDGLAGTLVVLIAGVFGFYFYQANYAYGILSVCLIGSIAGFLRYNIYKATIFMGDTGSLLLGFIISILAVEFVEFQIVTASPAVAIAILIIPIVDTFRVFIMRIIAGTSPFLPDRKHVHHRLVDIGLSQLMTVVTLLLINITYIISAIFLSSILSVNWLIVVLIVVSGVLSFVLELLFNMKQKK